VQSLAVSAMLGQYPEEEKWKGGEDYRAEAWKKAKRWENGRTSMEKQKETVRYIYIYIHTHIHRERRTKTKKKKVQKTQNR
jgi:hypothetical protein